MKLYEIKEEYQRALHDLQQLEGVTPAIIEDSLASIDSEFDEKAIAVASYIKNLEAETMQMIAYADAMDMRIKAHKKEIERLEDYLKHNMLSLGKKTIKGIEFDIKVRKANFSVVVESEKDIGEEWFRTKVEKVLDKKALKAAFENGMQITGVRLEQGTSLVIK